MTFARYPGVRKAFTQSGYALRSAVPLLTVVGVFFWLVGPAIAAPSQHGEPQVSINPGGGIETDGSDGIRFTINSESASGTYNSAAEGQDSLVYRATRQYCCSTAGAPHLNIGGTLYGQRGAAVSSGSWSSLQILSTSGVVSEGARTTDTGSGSATLRYTVEKNGLTYVMDRTMTYTYPNDFITDSYTFTIPAGNDEEVKFYLGGDAAPGSSDSGYGIMLTEPVRSVISLNTSSQIMFGFREVAGSKTFDGATSQSYSAPYTTVRTGGDIGFIATASTHDAGLMMQWNLGSTPGTQTATLQQFATQQGTNLNASFGSNLTEPNTPVNINIQAVNTVLATANGIGYTATLPAGLVVASGSPSNACGGTLTASEGGSSIVLSGASVAAATNCLVSVPVVASIPNSYTISSASFTDLANINNNVGTSELVVTDDNDGDGVSNAVEESAPNDGDANDDGLADKDQENVTSVVNSATDEYTTLAVDSDCDLVSVSIKEENQLAADDGHIYPLGLVDFTANCLVDGSTTTVTQHYFSPPDEEFVPRKYANGAYQTLNDATTELTEIDSQQALVISYEVTDGGVLDDDGEVNGEIVDPAGPGVVVPAGESPDDSSNGGSSGGSSGNGGSDSDGSGVKLASNSVASKLVDAGQPYLIPIIISGLLLISGAFVVRSGRIQISSLHQKSERKARH